MTKIKHKHCFVPELARRRMGSRDDISYSNFLDIDFERGDRGQLGINSKSSFKSCPWALVIHVDIAACYLIKFKMHSLSL